jgi:hypothetical protein
MVLLEMRIALINTDTKDDSGNLGAVVQFYDDLDRASKDAETLRRVLPENHFSVQILRDDCTVKHAGNVSLHDIQWTGISNVLGHLSGNIKITPDDSTEISDETVDQL